MKKEQKFEYDGGYSFLQNLAMELSQKGRVDRAERIILYMMQKWPERVIGYKDIVQVKNLKTSAKEPLNP